MRHEDRPRNIPDLVHAAEFPVYGLVNNPFDLVVCGFSLGISPLLHLLHAELEFRNFPSGPDLPQRSFRSFPLIPKFPQRSFRITSFDAMHKKAEWEEDRVFNVKDLCDDKDVKDSTLWQGKVFIAGDVFSGDIIHWDEPFQATTFLLQSQKIILLGKAYNFSHETILHLLESLQVINDQEGVIEQYHHENQAHHLILEHVVICPKLPDQG